MLRMTRQQRKMLYLHSDLATRSPLRKEGEAAGGATGSPGVAQPSDALAAALASGNNNPQGQGNSDPGTSTPGADSNNTGDTFDPASFWESPAPKPGTSAPSGESAGGTPAGESGAQGGGENLATQLATQIQSLSFGEPIFDANIAGEINQGNFEGVQKRLNASMQTAVRQALAMNVQVLRPFAEQLMSQMREEFGGTLNQRDNQSTLVRDFPAAANPTVAPMIQQVYDQALKRTSGNREKAVTETKRMLAFMANTTAGDLGLDVAPSGSMDRRPPNPKVDWLDELTRR